MDSTPRGVDTNGTQRLSFLEKTLDFSENAIRAFDIKAQISGAAFILSIEPLWLMLTGACARAPSHPMVMGLAVLFVATIGMFFFVLWPVPSSGAPTQPEAKNLFFLRDTSVESAEAYVASLSNFSAEAELISEIFKLTAIRNAKKRRFQLALAVTALFYAIALGTIVGVRC